MNRRRFVVNTVALGASITLDGGLPAAAKLRPGRVDVRIGYVGRPCEAAAFAAYDDGTFQREGIDARLVRFGSERDLVAAIGAGSVDAGAARLPALLTPFERGRDIRVVAGLHAGCLRVVAPESGDLGDLADLRGKTLGTDELHGPAMNLLSALLRKNRIDPHNDVSWRVVTAETVDAAFEVNGIAALAAADPLAYRVVDAKKAEPYFDPAAGGFSCGSDIAHAHHCFLALHGAFLRRRAALAASTSRAFLGASRRIGAGVGPAAVASVQGRFVDADLRTTIGMLASYDWSPSTELVVEEVELTARDFRRADLLQRSTDPEQLAQDSYADVLHV